LRLGRTLGDGLAVANLPALSTANSKRWNAAKLTRGPEFVPVAKRLAAPSAKARYQKISEATGVPWFVIAVIHEREASQRWDRQLGQGDKDYQCGKELTEHQ